MVKNSSSYHNSYSLEWVDLTLLTLYQGERNAELIKRHKDILNNVLAEKRVIEFKITPKQKTSATGGQGRHFMWARFPGPPEKKGENDWVSRGLYVLTENGIPTRLLMEAEIGLYNKADVYPCVVSSVIPSQGQKPSKGTKYADKPIWERIANIDNWSLCSPEFLQKARARLAMKTHPITKVSAVKKYVMTPSPKAPKNRVMAKAKKIGRKPPTRKRHSRQTVSGVVTPENYPVDASVSPTSDEEAVAATDTSADIMDCSFLCGGSTIEFYETVPGCIGYIFSPDLGLDDVTDTDNDAVPSTSPNSSHVDTTSTSDGTSEPLYIRSIGTSFSNVTFGSMHSALQPSDFAAFQNESHDSLPTGRYEDEITETEGFGLDDCVVESNIRDDIDPENIT